MSENDIISILNKTEFISNHETEVLLKYLSNSKDFNENSHDKSQDKTSNKPIPVRILDKIMNKYITHPTDIKIQYKLLGRYIYESAFKNELWYEEILIFIINIYLRIDEEYDQDILNLFFLILNDQKSKLNVSKLKKFFNPESIYLFSMLKNNNFCLTSFYKVIFLHETIEKTFFNLDNKEVTKVKHRKLTLQALKNLKTPIIDYYFMLICMKFKKDPTRLLKKDIEIEKNCIMLFVKNYENINSYLLGHILMCFNINEPFESRKNFLFILMMIFGFCPLYFISQFLKFLTSSLEEINFSKYDFSILKETHNYSYSILNSNNGFISCFVSLILDIFSISSDEDPNSKIVNLNLCNYLDCQIDIFDTIDENKDIINDEINVNNSNNNNNLKDNSEVKLNKDRNFRDISKKQAEKLNALNNLIIFFESLLTLNEKLLDFKAITDIYYNIQKKFLSNFKLNFPSQEILLSIKNKQDYSIYDEQKLDLNRKPFDFMIETIKNKLMKVNINDKCGNSKNDNNRDNVILFEDCINIQSYCENKEKFNFVKNEYSIFNLPYEEIYNSRILYFLEFPETEKIFSIFCSQIERKNVSKIYYNWIKLYFKENNFFLISKIVEVLLSKKGDENLFLFLINLKDILKEVKYSLNEVTLFFIFSEIKLENSLNVLNNLKYVWYLERLNMYHSKDKKIFDRNNYEIVQFFMKNFRFFSNIFFSSFSMSEDFDSNIPNLLDEKQEKSSINILSKEDLEKIREQILSIFFWMIYGLNEPEIISSDIKNFVLTMLKHAIDYNDIELRKCAFSISKYKLIFQVRYLIIPLNDPVNRVQTNSNYQIMTSLIKFLLDKIMESKIDNSYFEVLKEIISNTLEVANNSSYNSNTNIKQCPDSKLNELHKEILLIIKEYILDNIVQSKYCIENFTSLNPANQTFKLDYKALNSSIIENFTLIRLIFLIGNEYYFSVKGYLLAYLKIVMQNIKKKNYLLYISKDKLSLIIETCKYIITHLLVNEPIFEEYIDYQLIKNIEKISETDIALILSYITEFNDILEFVKVKLKIESDCSYSSSNQNTTDLDNKYSNIKKYFESKGIYSYKNIYKSSNEKIEIKGNDNSKNKTIMNKISILLKESDNKKSKDIKDKNMIVEEEFIRKTKLLQASHRSLLLQYCKIFTN